jgi:tripartite-type tricarboxylate transporter receptor subunit TctC
MALARAKPRMLNYASAGPATLAHLAGALFEKMAGIELTHVPYRGTAQSTLDLLEGRVEMQFGTIPPALTHIRAGKLRALAVTSAARNPALPDVPTLAESGLQGYECLLWQAIVAPATASPTLTTRLSREIGAVLDDPELRAAFAKNGIEAQASTPAGRAHERRRKEVARRHRQRGDYRELTDFVQAATGAEFGIGLSAAHIARMRSAINPLWHPRHG